MSGPDPELLAWLALRRVRGGGVAKVGSYYLDRGFPVPGYLADPLAELTQDGLVALADADPTGLRRATITHIFQRRTDTKPITPSGSDSSSTDKWCTVVTILVVAR